MFVFARIELIKVNDLSFFRSLRARFFRLELLLKRPFRTGMTIDIFMVVFDEIILLLIYCIIAFFAKLCHTEF